MFVYGCTSKCCTNCTVVIFASKKAMLIPRQIRGPAWNTGNLNKEGCEKGIHRSMDALPMAMVDLPITKWIGHHPTPLKKGTVEIERHERDYIQKISIKPPVG